MHPQTLISISTALFLGLMSFVFTGIEAAPVKMRATPMKSATPVKRAITQTARINIIKAVLKPARTKGKLTLQVTLHNPTATRATAFTVKAMHQRRVVGKTNLKGLNARTRISRTLRNLPQQKGQRCVSVRLTKPRSSKLKLGKPLRTCLKSPMVIRKGIDTSPGRKVGTRGKLGNTSRIGVKSKVGTKGATRAVKRSGRKQMGKYTRKGLSGIKYALGPGSLTVNGSTGPVSVAPGNAINVTWNLSSANNPNNTGIYLLISDVSGSDGNCAATAPYLSTAFGSNDEGHKAGTPTGNYTLSDFSNFQVGRTYYLKGCLWNLGGNPEYSGEETNVVVVRYQTQTLTCNGKAVTIAGTPGDDVINGTPGNDVIHGGDGNDTILGGGGNDTICGGAGDDFINGQGGNDFIKGGVGHDDLYGNVGHDTLHGGTGSDRLYGGSGSDKLYGNVGQDTLIGNDGDDYLYGGDNNDVLWGDYPGNSPGNDVLYGGGGNDVLYGGGGNDVLYGDADHDTLHGGTGHDRLYGNAGNDTIKGGDGNDKLYGGTGNDKLYGGPGTDLLSGGPGSDRLVGHWGIDTFDGGGGGDTYVRLHD